MTLGLMSTFTGCAFDGPRRFPRRQHQDGAPRRWVLEGKGVEPDVAVAFDVRHAAGRDRQLEAALDQLVAP
jgi:hypothetical protein